MSYDFDLPHAVDALANGAGVQPWSSPEQYVIFSIATKAAPASARRIKGLEDWLDFHGIGHKRLIGAWQGALETSWIINARDWCTLAAADWLHGQECVLHLGPYEAGGRVATLYYPRMGKAGVEKWQESIGRFQQVSEKFAKAQEGWTFDPSTGEYFCAY